MVIDGRTQSERRNMLSALRVWKAILCTITTNLGNSAKFIEHLIKEKLLFPSDGVLAIFQRFQIFRLI